MRTADCGVFDFGPEGAEEPLDMSEEVGVLGHEKAKKPPILWWCGWVVSVLISPVFCWLLSQLLCSLLTSAHPKNSEGKLNYVANHILMFLDHPLIESGLSAFLTPFWFVALFSGFAPHSRFKIAWWFSGFYWIGNFLYNAMGMFSMDVELTPGSAMVWLLPLSVAGNIAALWLMRWLDRRWSGVG